MNQAKYQLQPLTFKKGGQRPVSKPLPSTPGSALLSSLEVENEMLRKENETLRHDIQVGRDRIRRYRRITVAAKAFFRQTTLGAQKFEDILLVTQQEKKDTQYSKPDSVVSSIQNQNSNNWI
ncbi:hypothetical protein OCU04_004398 [Sclerotinia nivalis]|uniref:Uncharacterized protein n=1 Tax=Sclerotinia nivalis TaxID=352851 RepID=A0A9X0ATR6_9HELO|nr:hypothetical protein OCU04_004398 [Sclerotinia nivalis]